MRSTWRVRAHGSPLGRRPCAASRPRPGELASDRGARPPTAAALNLRKPSRPARAFLVNSAVSNHEPNLVVYRVGRVRAVSFGRHRRDVAPTANQAGLI